jgi:hypothetical protein
MSEPDETLARAKQTAASAPAPIGPARDPEEAQRALLRVQALLERQRRVESLVHREQTPADEKKALVEQLVPELPASPARVVTTPACVMRRMVLLPWSAT